MLKFIIHPQVTEEALRVSSTQHSTASQEATANKDALQRAVKQLSEQRDQVSSSN